MSLGLRFTDGTATVTVSDGVTGYLTGYRPGGAPEEVEHVTDKARALFVGGRETVRANVQALNRILRQANVRREEQIGPRVFVERDLGDGVWWRSEIYEAVPLPEEQTLDIGLAAGKMEFDLLYTRYNWWEGAESQVPLTNPNGTNNTLGLTVHNPWSGTVVDNYVDIAAASVPGDLPAPTRIELTNLHTIDLGDVWIGHNFTNPTAFSHILEAEDATGATPTANGNYSGDAYVPYSLPTDVETDLASWALSSAQLTAAAGHQFKMIFAFVSPIGLTNNEQLIRWRLRIEWNSATIWRSHRLASDGRPVLLHDFLTMRLPPWLQGESGLAGVNLVLSGYQTSGATLSPALDFIQMTPVDGWRHLYHIGSVPQNSRLVDDGINRILYRDDGAGSGKIGPYRPHGDPIALKPGVAQRLIILQHTNQAYDMSALQAASVKLFCRPRRLTV